jgi:hypothetical protein
LINSIAVAERTEHIKGRKVAILADLGCLRRKQDPTVLGPSDCSVKDNANSIPEGLSLSNAMDETYLASRNFDYILEPRSSGILSWNETPYSMATSVAGDDQSSVISTNTLEQNDQQGL